MPNSRNFDRDAAAPRRCVLVDSSANAARDRACATPSDWQRIAMICLIWAGDIAAVTLAR
jgi:hypothetical protein